MTSAPNRFITNLKSFNRKERYFLVGWTLGNREFRLGPEFRAGLSSVLNVNIPRDAFVAMDYHLDWIYASAVLSTADDTSAVFANPDGLVSGNQEDIDLVIAFEDGAVSHVMMVEAKGVTGWRNEQLNSKTGRLRAIFGQHGESWPNLRPHFVLTSARESRGLDCSSWPSWMRRHDSRPYWMRMEIPAGLLRVTRCDEMGRVTAAGGYWKVVGSR